MNTEFLSKDLKHNMIVNILDGAFFGLAMGFASYSTMLPLFVNTMTGSALLIGLIPAIHNASWHLPQMFMAQRVARLKHLKPMVLFITIFERLPFLGLALVAWQAIHLGNSAALGLAMALITCQSLGAGFTANAWQSLIAKIIPSDRRGTFFGTQAAASSLLSSGSAVLAGLILEKIAAPFDYTLCFLLTCVFMVVSWWFLNMTREPAGQPQNFDLDSRSLWNNLSDILRRDSNFCWYLAARSIIQFAIMSFAFYTVFAVNHHGVSEAQIGVMTSVLLIVQTIANPLMGWLGDRWSHLRLMEVGVVAAIISSLLAWWAPSAAWFYPAFALQGVAVVSVWTLGMSITLEFGSEAERPAYIGLANSLVAPANIAAPFFGGWLADATEYSSTFLGAAVGGVVAILMLHFLVKDPRKLRRYAE